MRIDLQVHTTLGSPDSHLSPGELAAAARREGLQAVAVTEHVAVDYAILREALGVFGVMLVPAREVACAGKHLLVLSADEALLTSLGAAVPPDDPSLFSEALACIWAHPAAMGGSSAYPPFVPDPDEISPLLHGVEVLNGKHLHLETAVRGARDVMRALGLCGTGGSDSHQVTDVGRCLTEVDASVEDGPKGVVAALREGRARPVLSARWARRHGYHYRESLQEFLE